MSSPAPIRIAMAQINATVGAMSANADRIVARIDEARRAGAHLVAFPELAVCGYPPEDLLFHPRFVDENRAALDRIAAACDGIHAVVGFVDRAANHLYNAAAVLGGGRVAHVYHKAHLPNYGVFDEQRDFTPGGEAPVFRLGQALFGINVCEDIWIADGPARAQGRAGARLILNINASPYHAGRREEREQMLRERAGECGATICYTNLVGGQDELVFDGQSLVVTPDGTVLAHGPAFEEALLLIDLPASGGESAPADAVVLSDSPLPTSKTPVQTAHDAPLSRLEEIRRALLLGIRDYFAKNGFEKALIGLSGGVDSALVAVLAAEALGAENVTCVFMPSRYSADESRTDAMQLARNLGVTCHEIGIEGLFSAYLDTLSPLFGDRPPNEAEENLQARVRGNLLMGLSNKFGWLVLTTGNKSEMSVGYATLYGDMAGGFAVIKDVPKTLVYELARWRNAQGENPVLPERVLTRPPSAELRPDQQDTDSLPPYEVLDPILEAYVEKNRPVDEIAALGFDATTVRRVIGLVDRAEYKRRQAPPGIRITPRAFGRDRRMPITNRFRE